MSKLHVGDRAPDFSLSDERGNTISLSEMAGKTVVLFFYPADDSPVCTKEACSFRDAYQNFVDAGAEVIGISSDTGESHRHFSGKHHLPYHLLSDEDGSARKDYGIGKTLGVLPGRETFVIDGEGIIRHTFSSQLMAERHVEEALKKVKELIH